MQYDSKSAKNVIMPNHIHGIIEIVGADSISAQITNPVFAYDLILDDKRADMESAPTGMETYLATKLLEVCRPK